MSTTNEEVPEDPFSPANIGVVHFIQQARIYDALLAILTELNPTRATDLLEMHAQGHIVGPSPTFSGTFVTDAVNE